jgi:pimeloyl-ACP methyl ester carboxylesterase
MRTFALLLFVILTNFNLNAQDISGQWHGILKVQGTQLRLILNITKTENIYSSTMDSPDQGATGIPVTSTTFENSKLKFEVTNARIEYNGEFKDNQFVGIFKQGGMEFPMNLSKKPITKPQEPTIPYSYYTEEVTFLNPKANIELSGTLSLPEKQGNFPVVILISGSGPQNRDEELLGHKPFLIISDYLTKKGIAVLRYDDRGTGQSKGDFQVATTADFATDVESAIAFLKTRKEINKTKIGLVGHSEGGVIAPMVASENKDVDFIVLLAGTGIRGDKLLLLQQESFLKASGATESEIIKSTERNAKAFDMVIKSNDDQKLKKDLSNLLNETPTGEIPNGLSKEDFVTLHVNQITSPWMQYFLKLDPSKKLEKVKCAVLAINGEKDLQVPSKENLGAIKKALTKSGNKNVTTHEFPNLNHLFQECTTGLPSEYAEIEQTISPKVLEEVTNWILAQTI